MTDEEYLQKNLNPEWLAEHRFEQTENRSLTYQLFAHWLSFGNKNQPNQKWLSETQNLIESIGKEKFLETYLFLADFFCENEEWFIGKKTPLLKGYFWSGLDFKTELTVYEAFRKIIERAYLKIPGVGAFAASVGNAGLKVLAEMATPEAIQLLFRLKARAKYNIFAKAIQQNIKKITENQQVNELDLQERSIPDFGIQDRTFEQKIGDFTAQVYIENYQKIIVEWLKPDGKTQKSEPSVIKNLYSTDLQAFKHKIQEIKQLLQAQRHRLEEAWQQNRVWKYEDWEKNILNHPLFSILSQQLIWQFESNGKTQNAIYNNSQLIDYQGDISSPPSGEPEVAVGVKLWHPIQSSVEEVLAWREYMFVHEIKQPFKQAFREVYVLTEAEKNTATYSNRFSAHILRQKQLWALANQRNWKYRGSYGYAFDVPTLRLPEYDLQVLVDLTFNNFEYVSTQRVKFLNLTHNQALRLENIPPIAFSEAMRDIDLFIAVCSIGNDPNWTGDESYQDYWEDYAFGEKSETTSAKNRKEILEKIVPKLKIATKCSFEHNFLVVEGKLKTYKINMGSGNILMKPNDQYLCIVPDRKAQSPTQHVFLPFEGDSILSLILSKAFLLVEDDKITDKTILSQLGVSD